MDQAFFMRAKRLLEQRGPARLDHSALLAAVTARQSASATAAAAPRARQAAPPRSDLDALVALLLGEPGADRSAVARSGCFNRAVAKRPVNTA